MAVVATAAMFSMTVIPSFPMRDPFFVPVLVIVGVLATVPVFFSVSMSISMTVFVRVSKSDAVLVTVGVLASMRGIVSTMMTCNGIQTNKRLGQGHAWS